MADGLPARIAVFVVLLVATAGVATAVAGVGGGGAAPTVDELTVESFESESSVATPAPEDGTVEMSADAEDKVVVVDAGHGADIDKEALAPFASTLSENGATVKYFVGPRQGGETLNETLRDADAFVTFGATQRYTDAELDGLEAFTDAGGRVLAMNEPASASGGLGGLLVVSYGSSGPPMPMAPLMSQYGMAYESGYLYNMHDYDVNYRNVYATPTGDSPLTEGVDRLVFHEARPVAGGSAVVTASERTALSATRTQDTYGVVARSGNVVAVGDTSVVGQDFTRRADNEAFVGNLLDFLVSGEKDPENAPQRPVPEPTQPPEPPEGGGGNSTTSQP
jgi:hypothetical protein